MNQLKLYTIALLICIPLCMAFQHFNYWNILANIETKSVYDNSLGYEVDQITYGENVKKLIGKKIQLEGYWVPLDEFKGKKYFVLSSLPFNVCYFCGAAGPETVIEVYAPTADFDSNVKIKVEGYFQLNENNYDHLMYQLKDAKTIN